MRKWEYARLVFGLWKQNEGLQRPGLTEGWKDRAWFIGTDGKIVELTLTPDWGTMCELNRLGAEGWEVISVSHQNAVFNYDGVHYAEPRMTTYLLKRPAGG